MYNQELIPNYFDLPISFISKKQLLDKTIINDLELIKSYDNKNKPIYNELFNPDDKITEETTKLWVKYYTNDTTFLKDSKKLYKNIKINQPNNYNKFTNLWFEIMNHNDMDFLSKYHFVDSKYLRSFNNNSKFLTYLSIYNMISPVIALITPIIILIIPFLVLKVKKVPITISDYKTEINKILGKHIIGNFYKNFNKVSINKKLYMICSLSFYIFQMYQNCVSCHRFYKNQQYIHNFFNETKAYIDSTIKNMDNYLNYTINLKTYNNFNNNLIKHKNILASYYDKISYIERLDKKKVHKNINQVGILMKEFHRARFDDTLEKTFLYSLGFNGYYKNIYQLKLLLINKNVNFCKFNNSTLKFEGIIYPLLNNNPKVVKNNINLNKNIIVTGPNAAGKTTFIKAIMINTIISQQLCLGFYKNATISPFEHLHCYINIPDTSGRDSLFQAEARRCKQIIESINDNSDSNHFCLFDELYSGTNPDEASASAYAFIDYLTRNNNIKFVLTTHFVDVCEKLDLDDNIINLHMGTKISGGKISYKYKVDKGISKIKGGLEILKDLNYPENLINKANNFL